MVGLGPISLVSVETRGGSCQDVDRLQLFPFILEITPRWIAGFRVIPRQLYPTPQREGPQTSRPGPLQALSTVHTHTLFHTLILPLFLFHLVLLFLFASLLTGSYLILVADYWLLTCVYKGFILSFTFLSISLIVCIIIPFSIKNSISCSTTYIYN